MERGFQTRPVLFATSLRDDTMENPFLISLYRKKWIFVNSLFCGLTVNQCRNFWSQTNEAR